MNNQIQTAYVNALLADASYVRLQQGDDNSPVGQPIEVGQTLTNKLAARLTATQADFITDNFEVVNQELSPTGGFDAVVWRGKTGTDYAGKVYVSIRGTQGLTDIADDGQLASTGMPQNQIVSMVNWWLRMTTPSNAQAQQIAWDPLHTDPANPLQVVPSFVTASSVAGSGTLVGQSSIEGVNGHSLGGYLATAFTRLFGGELGYNVQTVNTFNSAGFNNLQVSNIESSYNQIAQLIGSSLGLGGFAAVASKQTNLFGQNGIEFTTNSWADIGLPGFNQYGQRVDLYQEDLLTGGATAPINNHSMYKLTDALALGAALEKLDSTFTMDKLNAILKAGSNDMAASYEGVLDSLRRALAGPNIQTLPTSDAGGSDPSRVLYHATLAEMQNNPIYKDLIGKLHIEPANKSLGALARRDFGALISLQDLSPLYISGITAAAQAQLAEIWQAGRPTDYTAWQADKSANTPSTFTDQWIADRAVMLSKLIERNAADNQGILSGATNTRYFDKSSNTEILVGAGSAQRQQFIFGSAGSDSEEVLSGQGYADHIYGGAGDDTLDGKGGSDYLEGGTGADIYQFSGSWGKDIVLDADGQGQIQLDGQTIGAATAAGRANQWKTDLGGAIATLTVRDDPRSSTGKSLIITRGIDSTNSITLNNFDLVQAQANGYLGIKLDSTKKLALQENTGTNLWSDPAFSLANLAGKASALVEGTAKTFTLYLNQAAKAGETITLALSDLADKFKAILGDSVVAADGAVITLAEGQTQVSFALLQEGGITADAGLQLSATYAGADQSVTSNAWSVNLMDAGEAGQTMSGDQRARLIGIETRLDVIPGNPGFGTYAWNETSWAADGTLNNGVAEANFNDVIYGAAGNDKMLGMGGNDALDGGAGNDRIDGGEGDDLIGGGAGSDSIQGGAGNDYILSATGLGAGLRVRPEDDWTAPVGATVLSEGNTWGVYRLANHIYSTGGSLAQDDSPDVINAGDGNDWVIAGRGADLIEGGLGDDDLTGGGGDDVINGGDGRDFLWGDGLVAAGYYDSTPAELHGADFLDGGAGDDQIVGNGGNDVLYGGTGADLLVGDHLETDLSGEFHGMDYLDGEDGDDSLYGGGSDDILYGGAGDDLMEGDGVQSQLSGAYHGNDYLDGEDGNDTLYGGGRDDTLYGGSGNDVLYGDAPLSDLDLNFHGDDYLAGGDGDDRLEGGGGNDTLLGGSGNDTLLGDAGADYLDGGDGDDAFEAGAGDVVVGGSGINTLKLIDGEPYAVSASGSDLILDYGDNGSLVVSGALNGSIESIDGISLGDWLQGRLREMVDLATTGSHQRLSGGSGDDHLTALHGYATLVGGGGGDTLLGSVGDDTLDGGSGNDVLDAGAGSDQLIGGAGNDILISASGDDTLDGGDGNDAMFGDAGNDILYGGAGNDVVDGGDGNDLLFAGKGLDTLKGGLGIDTYMLGYGTDQVTVVDGSEDGSIIQLDAPGIHLDGLRAVRSNNDLVIRVLGTDTSMRIQDYYGTTQISWVIKDSDGNSITAQALMDASKPHWGNLIQALLQEFKNSALGAIGKDYSEQGYLEQGDGRWVKPSNFGGNGGAELFNSHQESWVYSQNGSAWVQNSYSSSWTTGDWRQSAYSAADATVTFFDSPSVLAAESLTLNPITQSSASQMAWGAVNWTNYSTWVNKSSSFSNGANGLDGYKFIETQNEYLGRSNALRFDSPGEAALAGPLPAYVAVQFTHYNLNYNLGTTTLADGNHSVWADQYSAVVGGVGDNTIRDAGFAYGGTGNARLIGGDILMAGAGEQYLEYGKTMVVGDGHDTVVGHAGSRILVDPNNAGIDLLVSDFTSQSDLDGDGVDDVIDSIYASLGINSVQESYQHGGKYLLNAGELGRGYFETSEEARAFYDGLGENYIPFDEAIRFVKPLPFLLRTPCLSFDPENWGASGSYYDAHPLQTSLLTGNNFTALQPYLDSEALPTKTVSFGEGLSLADIQLSWGEATSPLDGNKRITLDLQWGPDQGVRVMIPRSSDMLNGTVQSFEFSDGSIVSLSQLIAMAPPAPNFDSVYAHIYAGMGEVVLDAWGTPGIYAEALTQQDLAIHRSGLDLVVSINGSTDSLRLQDWYSRPYEKPSTLLSFESSPLLTADILTKQGLVLDGSSGNLTLDGLPGFASTFIAGPNSILNGASGMDIYVINAGSGEVHITDPGGGTLQFGAGITPDMVTLGLGSLMLKVGNQGDVVHLEGFDPSAAENFGGVQSFKFADGTMMELGELLQKGFDLDGTAHDDVMTGTDLVDRFHQSAGNDTMSGGLGADSYEWGRGQGDDRVLEDVSDGSVNSIFLTNLRPQDVTVSRGTVSNDLLVTVKDTGETLTVASNFSMPGYAVGRLVFSDGTELTSEQISTALGMPFELVQPLPDQSTPEDAAFNWTVPADTFASAYGVPVTMTAMLANGDPLPPWLSFDPQSTSLSGVPSNGEVGNIAVKIIATDIFGRNSSDEFVVSVTNTNDAPAVANELINQQAVETQVFTYALPANTFADVDVGDQLTLSATLAGGAALPSWLVFDAATQTLSGTPTDTSAGVLNITVTAADNVGAVAAASFSIEIANIITGTANADTLTGTDGRDVIFGLDGDNVLNGGAGADVLIGGNGNDTYIVDNTEDMVKENANEGIDTVQSSVNYTLGSSVENLTLTGTAALSGVGNELDNTLQGNDGASTLAGGLGNDTYVIYNAGTSVVENANEGIDTVETRVDYTLGANIENARVGGWGWTDVTGNELDNIITGNTGNNVLNGGAGADTLAGGDGNDTYVVDNIGDVVIENGNEGVDTIQSSVSYTLGANIENLILTGSAALSGTGNSLDNVIEGNDGASTLAGGLGNDTYVIYNAGTSVVENANEGIDTVETRVDYTLGANIENARVGGWGWTDLTGNALDNVLTGNEGGNILDGEAGNDTLIGGAGNDKYQFGLGYGQDIVVENDATAGNYDKVRFGAGVMEDQLWFRHVGNDLEVSIIGTENKMTIQDWYSGSANHVEEFLLSDWRLLTDTNVENLVQAMASFSPPAAGQTTLPQDYQNSLSPTIAANWQW